MKIKLNIENATKLWMFGLLFTPYIVRCKFMPEVIAAGNFISIAGIILILSITNNETDNFEKITWLFVAFSFLLSIFHLMDIRSIIKTILSIYFPVSIFHISKVDNNTGRKIFKVALSFFNLMAYILLFISLVDFITHHSISINIAEFLNTKSVIGQAKENRLVSFFGHSLNTMLFMLGYYILHVLDSLYVSKNRKKIIIPTVISMIVIASTGSKTGLILTIIITIICYGNKKMIKYVPIIIIIIIFMFHYNLLEVVLERLSIGIDSGDITTGRMSALTMLIKSGQVSFNLFKGHDASLIYENVTMVAAFENPILRWAFRDGVIYAILMAISVLIIPIIRVFRNRNLKIGLLAFIYVVGVNTFDTICSIGDSMLMSCTILVLIIIVSNINHEDIFYRRM